MEDNSIPNVTKGEWIGIINMFSTAKNITEILTFDFSKKIAFF